MGTAKPNDIGTHSSQVLGLSGQTICNEIHSFCSCHNTDRTFAHFCIYIRRLAPNRGVHVYYLRRWRPTGTARLWIGQEAPLPSALCPSKPSLIINIRFIRAIDKCVCYLLVLLTRSLLSLSHLIHPCLTFPSSSSQRTAALYFDSSRAGNCHWHHLLAR